MGNAKGHCFMTIFLHKSRLISEIEKEMSHVYFEEVVVWNNFKMFGCQAQMFHFKSLEQSLMQKMLNGGTVSKLSFLGLHLSGSSTG